MSYHDIDGIAQRGKPMKLVLVIRPVEYRYGYMAREGHDLLPITTKTTMGTEIVREVFVHPSDARTHNEPKLSDKVHIVNCHLTEAQQRALKRRQRRSDGPQSDEPRRDYRDHRDNDEG